MGKGIGGHHSAASQSDEWLTPPELLAKLGEFDLDPCAPVERPWSTAREHYTINDNGLMKPWRGRVFCNPPYSSPWLWRFMARMQDHGRGTALVFARTETEWFFEYVWRGATALHFLEGRLNFHLPDGTRSKHNAGGPSVLCAYGFDDAERLGDSGIEGQFVPLLLPRSYAVAAIPGDPSWRELVTRFMQGRGAVRLDELYRAIEGHAKARGNQHWRAKVRQIVQQGAFQRVERGVWALA
jgi:hypothetical protein